MLILPFNRTENQLAGTYSLFGKLPNRPDFVRVNATHPAVLEFDAIIQNACERSGAAQPSGLPVDSRATVDFHYVSRDRRHLMIGVLTPSRDQAGRQYPFVSAAILPGECVEGYLTVSPIAYEVFFDGLREQVVNAVENSVEALSCRQFLETHLNNYDSAQEDFELARSVVARFMSGQPVSRLADLLSVDQPSATLQQALLNMAFYHAYLRRFDSASTNQLFVLPISQRKGEQSLIACAWLNILSSLWVQSGSDTSWRGSYFVRRSQSDGGLLVASVGRLANSFSHLLLGGELDEGMRLDLSRENEAWMSHRMYAEASYAMGRVLADPECSLSMLSGFLGGMSRQLEKSV